MMTTFLPILPVFWPRAAARMEFNGLDGLFGAGDGQAVFSGHTGGHDNGIVAGGDLFHGDVHTHAGVDAGAHAGFQHQAHFAVHHIAGRRKFGTP